MASVDRDVEEIIDETVDDVDKRELVRRIVEWEAERVHKTRRYDKKNELEAIISDYLEGQ